MSDIHDTSQALRRALEHMPSVDRVLCAGDAISPVFAVRAHALLGIVFLSGIVLLLPDIMDRTDPAGQEG